MGTPPTATSTNGNQPVKNIRIIDRRTYRASAPIPIGQSLVGTEEDDRSTKTYIPEKKLELVSLLMRAEAVYRNRIDLYRKVHEAEYGEVLEDAQLHMEYPALETRRRAIISYQSHLGSYMAKIPSIAARAEREEMMDEAIRDGNITINQPSQEQQ